MHKLKNKILSKTGRPFSSVNGLPKSAEPQADMSTLEGEIDQLVDQLYGLTKEEIKIVEGKE